MITCTCGKKFYDIREVRNVEGLGYALFGTCSKCERRIAVNELWRKILTIKGFERAKEYSK